MEDMMNEFDKRMNRLASQVRIWPPLSLTRAAADKWQMIVHLDHIAHDITLTPRPATQLLKDHIPAGKVIKRSFSAYQEHVHIPTYVEGYTWPTIEQLHAQATLPGREWLVQDWIPLLREYGEFKVYFIQKSVVHIALAKYRPQQKMWLIKTPKQFHTLQEIA